MLLESGQGHDRDRLCTVVHKFAVDLVGKYKQIVLKGHIAQGFELVASVHIAGRIPRIADQNGLGPRRNPRFKIGNRRQGKARLNAARYRYHLGAQSLSKTKIVGIIGLGNKYLVARIKNAAHGKRQGLRTSGGDQHILRLDMESDAPVVVGKTLAVARKTR